MWVNFNPLLQLCRRRSRLCQWLNISFRQKAFHGNFESVSKTKPTLPKFFDLPSSAVWPDRHWVYIEKTSNRPRRGKFTGHSRLASWSTHFCQWLKTKLKAIALCWKSSLLTTNCPIDRKELQSCRLFTSLVVRTHLAVYRGSKSTSFFCLLVSDEAHVVSIGAQGPGIFARLTREQKPKPDKALKASPTSVKARRSHGALRYARKRPRWPSSSNSGPALVACLALCMLWPEDAHGRLPEKLVLSNSVL